MFNEYNLALGDWTSETTVKIECSQPEIKKQKTEESPECAKVKIVPWFAFIVTSVSSTWSKSTIKH